MSRPLSDDRRERGFKGRDTQRGKPRAIGEREPRPRPIGNKCNPLCPYFRCSQRALRVRTEFYRGRPLKVPTCNWIGDKCIGAQCRYASCVKQAMLPDGRCLFAMRARQQVVDFEEELKAKSAIDEFEEEF